MIISWYLQITRAIHLGFIQALLYFPSRLDVVAGGQTFQVDALSGGVYTVSLHYMSIGAANATVSIMITLQ